VSRRLHGRRRHRGWIITAIVVAVLVAATGTAFAVDQHAAQGHVAHHIELLGRPVGGDTTAELRSTVDQLGTDYQHAAVHITSPGGTLDTTAAALGLALDPDATTHAALAIDTGGSGWLGPARWVRSLVAVRAAPTLFTIDETQLAAGAAALTQANHVDPVEPNITNTSTGVEPTPSAPGHAVDVHVLAQRLVAAADTGTTPISVDIAPDPVPPHYADSAARDLATQANAETRAPLTVSVGGKTAAIQPTTLRSWLVATPGPGGLQLQADTARISAELPPIVGLVGTPATQVSFGVVHDAAANADRVQINDGQNGSACCAPDSGQRIAAALNGAQSSVALDLQTVPPDHDHAWAAGLGIAAPIATFTTPHPCCAPRVTNIHLFADIVRGMVILPGQTFSLNGSVGQRTAARGFVDAPVIYNAEEDHDIGGGVSQFATTLFNASFFAGLDIPEYQAHSEYISRYPYGREATISWPSPDLKIKNITPYAIMIWPTYTDTSLTVTLWSTPWIMGNQTGQTQTPDGPCTKVTTERTRLWLNDHHTQVDHVYALYQPSDGVHCP
jgi:vancomycin resistance protein YoaR